jgi:O-methyltransferase
MSASALRTFCVRLGRYVPYKAIAAVDGALNYVETGNWFVREGFAPRIVPTRWAVHDEILARIAGRHVLYLEFGVWHGDMMRYWSQRIKHAGAHLHGFDSFAGLPDDWGSTKKEFFSTDGRVPEIDDTRVRFYKGWFEETLPAYEPPAHDVLVVNIDADLYSSARYVLKRLRNVMDIGTYLYFDELCVRQDELRAFKEFLAETGMHFEAIAATPSLRNVAFIRTG